jgi:hypothetical protein
VGADRKLAGQLTFTEDFDKIDATVGQTDGRQRSRIHLRAVFKLVEVTEVDRMKDGGVADVVKPALGDAANERHLTAFKTDADGAAGPCSLAFATTTAGFSMAAGFTLAKALAAVFGTGTGLQVM